MGSGDTMGLDTGISHPIGTGILDVAITWMPYGEVWETPYLTDKARDETDKEEYGLRLAWHQRADKPWRLEYRLNHVDIEHDNIGKLEEDLQRDGWVHSLKFNYTLPIHPGFSLHPQVKYTFADHKGLADSYNGGELGVSIHFLRPPWMFMVNLSAFYNQYQKTHPLYAET